MVDKKKQRHHELKDAAREETRWIEPIHNITKPIIEETAKTHLHHTGDDKITAKRENKKTHQHDFRHQQTLRVHESKKGE